MVEFLNTPVAYQVNHTVHTGGCTELGYCICRHIDSSLHAADIQGDSGGICTTLGNDSMSDSKQKSSYEHRSDFERLWSYDRLKLGIEGNDY